MGHKLLIALLVMTVYHVGVLLADDCEPSCVDTTTLFGERKCLPPTTMVEDPKNCTQFYFCLADCETTQQPLPCPPGEGFDPAAGACDAGMATCTPSCQPNTCHLTCNGTGDVIGDPSDCGIYYICYPHGPVGPFTCGTDAPYFNGETCVVEATECCQQDCSPWCDAVGTQVADPYDCHKYYICIVAGAVPDETVHFTCKNNEVFDVSLGRCVAGATCQVLCSGSSSPGELTTPLGGSSTTSGISSTAAVTPTSECLNSLTCTTAGNFAKCVTCQPDYFYCSAAGAQGESRTCSGNLVFNTDPNFPYCVQPSNCPYSP